MCCDSWGHKELDTTERLNRTELNVALGFPGDAVVKNLPANAGDTRKRHGFDPWVGKIPWRRKWQQYSCLGNPMDRAAWWATVHRVPKSQT